MNDLVGKEEKEEQKEKEEEETTLLANISQPLPIHLLLTWLSCQSVPQHKIHPIKTLLMF